MPTSPLSVQLWPARPSVMHGGSARLLYKVAVLSVIAMVARATQSELLHCYADLPPPAYPAVDAAPDIQIWKQRSLATIPAQAACPASPAAQLHMLVSVTGTFASAGGAHDILTRFGEISNYPSVRYWSTTDHQWRPLVVAATALTARDEGQPRADFTNEEIESGRDLYFSQRDSRGAGEVIYRMRLRESGQAHMAIETENVTAVRWLGLTLIKPGGLRATYFFMERAHGVWTYRSLTGIAEGNWLISGHENSYINRVVALYRHIVDIPTDLEPPAAY